MSVENAKKFREDFKENEELKEKIKKELELYKDSGKKEKEQIPEIARKLGYDFTDEEFKEANKALSDEELANVSGGYFGLGEDAPDGHEATCLMYYYDCMDDYYYKRGICKQCGSRDITWLEADNRESMKCWDCGYRMYKDW